MQSKREYIQELRKLQAQYDEIEREVKAMNETDTRYASHIRALEKIIFQVKAVKWGLKICTAPPEFF